MDDLVVVYRAAGMPEAEIIKGLLESAEIPVHLSYESAGVVYGLTVDGLGEVRVQVPAEFAPLALDLLEGQQKGESAPGGILHLRAPRPEGEDPDVA